MAYFWKPGIEAMLNVPQMSCIGDIKCGCGPVLHQHVEFNSVPMEKAGHTRIEIRPTRNLGNVNRLELWKSPNEILCALITAKSELVRCSPKNFRERC